VTLIVQAGGDNTLTVFGTSHATVDGFGGFSGVIAGSVYTILAFIGFEAAAPLAEEAKDPRRTIGLAVIYSFLVALLVTRPQRLRDTGRVFVEEHVAEAATPI
jgi:amino acid transporter